MNELIKEARRLCARFEVEEAPVSECMGCVSIEMASKLIEFCDALEKAQREIERLKKERDNYIERGAYWTEIALKHTAPPKEGE